MAKVSVKEIQKNYQPKIAKPKKIGTRESLATPKPSKSRFILRWSPTGKLFDTGGKIVDYIKETLSIRPAVNDKEKELWVKLKRLYEPDVEDLMWTHTQNLMHAPVEWKLYDTCGVHHVISKDQEMFMLVEKDSPLRKGLEIGMISYKLQVENYSQMANDLILKIYKIGRIVGNKMYKAFLLSVKSSHCQKKFSLLVRKVPPAEDKRCHFVVWGCTGGLSDRTLFASRIEATVCHLAGHGLRVAVYRGKENGVNILKSIDEGPF
nr:hypothetical protein [Tanacetum cinerariifolium]